MKIGAFFITPLMALFLFSCNKDESVGPLTIIFIQILISLSLRILLLFCLLRIIGLDWTEKRNYLKIVLLK